MTLWSSGSIVISSSCVLVSFRFVVATISIQYKLQCNSVLTLNDSIDVQRREAKKRKNWLLVWSIEYRFVVSAPKPRKNYYKKYEQRAFSIKVNLNYVTFQSFRRSGTHNHVDSFFKKRIKPFSNSCCQSKRRFFPSVFSYLLEINWSGALFAMNYICCLLNDKMRIDKAHPLLWLDSKWMHLSTAIMHWLHGSMQFFFSNSIFKSWL